MGNEVDGGVRGDQSEGGAGGGKRKDSVRGDKSEGLVR